MNDKELEKTLLLKAESKVLDYGPLFKNERTIIEDNLSIDISSILLNSYSLIKNTKSLTKVYDNIQKDLEEFLENINITKLAEDVFGTKVTVNWTNEIDPLLKYNIQTKVGEKTKELPISTFLAKLKPIKCYIVISHNAIDLVGQSIDKGWNSCTGYESDGKKGVNYDTIFKEIKYGGMVAYLIKGDSKDVESIMNDHSIGCTFFKNAIARISIKRFRGKGGDFAFIQEPRLYTQIGSLKIVKKSDFENKVKTALYKNNEITNKRSGEVTRGVKQYTDLLTKKVIIDLRKLGKYNKKTDRYDFGENIDIEITNDMLINGKLPFNFGIVRGIFNCLFCGDLISLEGVPLCCKGMSIIGASKVESLRGLENSIIDNEGDSSSSFLDLSSCESLKSLQYSPKKIGGAIYLNYNNNLQNLEGINSC